MDLMVIGSWPDRWAAVVDADDRFSLVIAWVLYLVIALSYCLVLLISTTISQQFMHGYKHTL
jgi:hypothetical protein